MFYPRNTSVSTRRRQNDKEAGAHDVRGSSAGVATSRSSDKDSYKMADASFGYVGDADLKTMQDLANNRSIRGQQCPGWQLT